VNLSRRVMIPMQWARKIRDPTGAHMDRTTRCLHCGKRLVPVPKGNGRTEFVCIRCDDPTRKDEGQSPT
jgi:hypothetical protein